MSTHNLIYRAKIRKKNVYYMKVGFKGGQNYMDMFL